MKSRSSLAACRPSTTPSRFAVHVRPRQGQGREERQSREEPAQSARGAGGAKEALMRGDAGGSWPSPSPGSMTFRRRSSCPRRPSSATLGRAASGPVRALAPGHAQPPESPSSCDRRVGAFFVTKKASKQRLVLDAGRSNHHLAPSEPVAFASGAMWAKMEIEKGASLHSGHANLRNAFYHLSLAPCLREHFGLRRVRTDRMPADIRADPGSHATAGLPARSSRSLQ